MRLAGGIEDNCLAMRQHGGHQDVLRRGDGSLVQQDETAGQRVFKRRRTSAEPDLRPQRLEPGEVRVEPTPSNCISARRRQHGASAPGQERTRKEDRGADLRRQPCVNAHGADPPRAKRHRSSRLLPRNRDAKGLRRLEHVRDVRDVRHILQRDRLLRQQHRRNHRQRRVLVPRNPVRPGNDGLAFDQKFGHATSFRR